MTRYYYRKREPKTNFLRLPLSLFFTISGISIIAWITLPILTFELFFSSKFVNFVKPIPEGVANFITDDKLTSYYGNQKIDFTKASNWFPNNPPQKINTQKPLEYTISIPKLGIYDAKAIIGGEDLSKGLVHYGGTGLPGEYGNGVVFGHSVLPVFYNPKNYKTIFSTLPTKLDIGDEIIVFYDGLTYKYKVINMRVVSPEDVSVLEQHYDNIYMSFVTCVPPGTYWKRLIVTTVLEKI